MLSERGKLREKRNEESGGETREREYAMFAKANGNL